MSHCLLPSDSSVVPLVRCDSLAVVQFSPGVRYSGNFHPLNDLSCEKSHEVSLWVLPSLPAASLTPPPLARSLHCGSKDIEARAQDLQTQGQSSALAVDALRKELEESRRVLSDLQVTQPLPSSFCGLVTLVDPATCLGAASFVVRTKRWGPDTRG